MKTDSNRARLFQAITQGMAETYKKKNSDYGNSFEESVDEWGTIAFLVRASDKWLRIKSLLRASATRRVADETVRDTLLDLANYCIMFVMWLDKRGEK